MLAYQSLIIYYFSGTGNAKNIAIWVSAFAKSNDLQVEIIDISAIDRLSVKPPPPGALLVFISPVHGFNYPPCNAAFY